MVIGIDGNEANVTNRVGVSVYTFEMLKYFASVANETQQFKVYLRNPALIDLPKENSNFIYQIVKPDFIWSQISLPIHLFTHKKPDVFFSPAHYAPRISPVPTVVTIHDLSYKYYPQEFLSGDLYKLNHWTEYSIKKANAVICVSEHTKNDLVKHYPEVEKKTTVILNGFAAPKKLHVTRYTLHDKHPYILFVGTIQPRKNITTLITAFEIFSKSHPEFTLKIVGRKGWLYKETFDKIKNSTVARKIEYLDFVDNDTRNKLYQEAYATVLPSHYEGFGLPILEALSQGSPVIASNSSSLPEVGGTAVLYCDPKNPQTIVDDLEKLKDKSLRSKLSAESKKQLSKFSWEVCCKNTLQVIKSSAQ